jgi:hypothetical protein
MMMLNRPDLKFLQRPDTVGVASRSSTQLLPKSSKHIKVFPPEVEFFAIEPDILHVIRMTVTNTDNVPHRIRFQAPKTREFRLIDTPDTATAPGLDVIVEIEFFTTVEEEYADSLIVFTETDQLVIPITASLPKSRIIFDGHLDLGMVVRDASVFGSVLLENEGERPGKFEFEWDSALPMKITPKTGVLQEAGTADSAISIKVEFFGGEAGVFRALAQLHLEHQETRAVDISVTVVDQEVNLLFAESKTAIDTMEFGAAFYDQPKIVKGILVNNGPVAASFSVMPDEARASPPLDPAGYSCNIGWYALLSLYDDTRVW